MTNSNNFQPQAAGEAAHTPTPRYLADRAPWWARDAWRIRDTQRQGQIVVVIPFEDTAESAKLCGEMTAALNAYDSDQRQISSLVVELQNERLERANDQRKIKALTEALLLDKTASVLGVCPASMLVFREAGYTGEANGGQMGKFVRDKKHAAIALVSK